MVGVPVEQSPVRLDLATRTRTQRDLRVSDYYPVGLFLSTRGHFKSRILRFDIGAVHVYEGGIQVSSSCHSKRVGRSVWKIGYVQYNTNL